MEPTARWVAGVRCCCQCMLLLWWPECVRLAQVPPADQLCGCRSQGFKPMTHQQASAGSGPVPGPPGHALALQAAA